MFSRSASVLLVISILLGSGTGSNVHNHDPEEITIRENTVVNIMSGSPIPLWPNPQRIPGERPGMIGNETIQCRPPNTPTTECHDRSVTNVTLPTLIPFVVPHSDAAMIVAPGGAYHALALDKEGTDIALWLNSIGISAFVLKYRVPDRPWLSFGAAPLMDAQRAMGMVRNMANHHHHHHKNSTMPSALLPTLNASKIGFMGFSAGGHLTGHLNVAWENRSYSPLDNEADLQSCRPDYSIMVYPWRSVSQPPVNEPLSGASALNVTNQTPPTLLVQTQDDPVHVENAIFYYLALKQHHVSPSELHVYPQGGHGYGRCTMTTSMKLGSQQQQQQLNDYEVCTWPDRAHAFLRTLGVAPLLSTSDGCGEKSTTA